MNRNAAPLATIVMYHVVRPASTAGPFQRVKGLDVSAFREQLMYIRAHYTIVRLFDLVTAAEGIQPLQAQRHIGQPSGRSRAVGLDRFDAL